MITAFIILYVLGVFMCWQMTSVIATLMGMNPTMHTILRVIFWPATTIAVAIEYSAYLVAIRRR